MNLSDISILTATFNQHDFTLNMLKSFYANVSKIFPQTYILDNSTVNMFPRYQNSLIHVIDNTNFKHTKDYSQPSKNHCSSIDYALHLIETPYILLCDNDIVFNTSMRDLLCSYQSYDIIGEIGWDRVRPDRLYPYMCIINLDLVKRNKIHYFDESRCMIRNDYMDTGCSFWNDMKAITQRIKRIKLSDYIIHLKGGTLHNKKIDELPSY